MNNSIRKFAKKTVLVVIPLLLAAAVVRAKSLPLPEPDPERGGIAVAVRGRFPAGTKSPAVQVYFVRLGDDVEMLAAESVIPSNFSKKKQVYLLNAKPGRYVAVSAELQNQGMDAADYVVFFDGEMIPQTEIEVIPGQITFMGDFLVDLKTKISESDEAQAHYHRLIEPAAARKGFMGRAFSGQNIYRGDLVSVERGDEVETEYWTLARDKVFKKDAAWREQVEKRIVAFGANKDDKRIDTDQNDPYGVSDQNPIMLGSKEGRSPAKVLYSYLDRLRGPKGEKVTYSRIGTCCEFETPRGLFGEKGVLEVWEVTYDGLSKPTKLFINVYDSGKVLPPFGLVFEK
jgi:hypothetical protein